MSGIGIGLSAAFGTKPLSYLLRDEFTDTRAAGSVNGTPAMPGPGTRTVVDTGNNLSLSGGVMTYGRTGDTDPGIWFDLLSRSAGRVLLAHANFDHINNWYHPLAFDDNQSGGPGEDYLRQKGGSIRVPAANVPVGAVSASIDYYLAIVLRSSGSFSFIKGGAFTNWTLLWFHSLSSANGYLCIVEDALQVGSANVSSYIRVPDALWLPVPLVSDGFIDSNGTSLDAHATDGAGHAEGVAGGIGAGGSGLSWTEDVGDWDIQSNRANPDGVGSPTVDVGEADVVIDAVVQANHTKVGHVLRWSDSSNYWIVRVSTSDNEIQIYEVNATVATKRASTAVTINLATDYDLRSIAYGQTIDAYVDGGDKATYGSAALNETVTVHGLRAYGTNDKFDDFVIYSRDGYSALDGF